jgi:ATP-dependent DNA helicase RecG
MDIIKLIKIKESQTLEFKRDTSALESILKAVIAFANTAGGVILIGVEDDGTITGLSDTQKSQEQLANAIAHRIKPQIIPDISVVEVKKKSVLVLQIEHIPAPYYLENKGLEKGTYIRLGNSNRLAGKEMIAEMKRASHHPFFDASPCDHTVEKDLDKNLIKKTFSEHNFTINTEKLLSLGVLIKKGKNIVASNGGVILFGNPEIRQTYFPFAEVRCARFAGTSRAEFIDRLNIDGSILKAIDEVPKFIRRNTKMAGKFGQMKRRDISEYPMDGVREALVNALTHANYEITGTRIFVAIYDDKLEIQNPGIMPPGMSVEQFKAGVSRIRNPMIARVFGELDLVEEWGSGYKRIKDTCKIGGYPEPKWEELGTVLRVTFFPHPEVNLQPKPSAETGTKLAPSWHQAEEIQKLIKFCEQPRFINEMLALLEWQDRTKFRKKFVNPLLEKGLLEMTIPSKPSSPNQQYILTKEGRKLLHK